MLPGFELFQRSICSQFLWCAQDGNRPTYLLITCEQAKRRRRVLL